MAIFNSYVKLPEGRIQSFQRNPFIFAFVSYVIQSPQNEHHDHDHMLGANEFFRGMGSLWETNFLDIS